jgi:hypothetical protein
VSGYGPDFIVERGGSAADAIKTCLQSFSFCDIDQTNVAFVKMNETLAEDATAKCRATGLISLSSEEEMQQMR